MTPLEQHLYEYLADAVEAAEEGDALFDVQLNDTIYRPVDKPSAIMIALDRSRFSPSSGADEVEEFDCTPTIIVVSLVTGDDLSDRWAAMGKALDISAAIAKLLFDDPTMGNRVNDARALECQRDWTVINSAPYALTNVPLTINESGGRDG